MLSDIVTRLPTMLRISPLHTSDQDSNNAQDIPLAYLEVIHNAQQFGTLLEAVLIGVLYPHGLQLWPGFGEDLRQAEQWQRVHLLHKCFIILLLGTVENHMYNIYILYYSTLVSCISQTLHLQWIVY